jgi:hypothetical protein
VQLKRTFNDINRTINTCAKSSGLRQYNLGTLTGKVFQIDA